MSDNPKEAEAKMAKAIFISADCWLSVFDLLPPRQLGLGIAMISDRFDFYVDEHFKTRKWALKPIQIRSKIGENGTKKMEIVNYYCKPMPIPQVQLPRKISGFECIDISYIDQNAIVFLRRFRPLFASFCPINLTIIDTYHNGRLYEFFLRNIWPMFGKNIHGLKLSATFFHHLRPFAPSILNDFPSLRFVNFYFDKLFTGFPCDDNAMESDGQAMAKWLFTPLQSNVPKVFKCALDTDDGSWSSNMEAFKAAFASASSPVNFIAVLCFRPSFAASVVPFEMTNEMTREQLALKGTADFNNRFLLIRCPIARDESKWTKWEEEAIGMDLFDQRNIIGIAINDENNIGNGLLDATPGPNDQQQK
ncbi:hypothetical protein niasHT_032956 [Heterodera trifolii]|uniref:Uncharacterized protein n=1 Tax=Heterodera trifolii TaxID=157864 RepID=A0ABD2HV36_9BILA